MFAIVKRYYDKGIYTKENVKIFVRAESITKLQYKEITKDDYIFGDVTHVN